MINKLKNNKFYSKLLKNSFWAFFGDSVTAVINIIITIILVKLIGNNNYGILVLGQSYMLVMDVVLNVQCWKSVIQFGQKAIVNDDMQGLCGYVKLGTILDLSTAILGGVISLLLVQIVGDVFNWSSEIVFCAKIFSYTIFSHFSGTTTAILRILNKFHLVALQKSLSSIIKLCSVLLLLFFKNINLELVVIIYCLTDIIGNLLLVIFAVIEFRKKCKLKNVFNSKMPKDKNEFLKFTLWGTMSEIVDVPVQYFDVFIISFLGTELVAVFKVFKQIVSILAKVTTPIYQAIMPQFSELNAKGIKEKGFDVVKKIRNVILMVMTPFSIIIGVSSIFWLDFAFGSIYAKYWYILLMFLLVKVFALSYTTIHPYFVSLGKSKQSATYVLFTNIIYVIISLVTIKPLGMMSIILCFAIQSSLLILLKVINIKKEINSG